MKVKLPFSKYDEPSAGTREHLPAIEAPWRGLVLVCSKCEGARRGPEPRAVRKGLRRLLGKPKQLRVLEVDCLQVCPERAVTVCVVDAEHKRVEVLTVGSEGELEALAETLNARAR